MEATKSSKEAQAQAVVCSMLERLPRLGIFAVRYEDAERFTGELDDAMAGTPDRSLAMLVAEVLTGRREGPLKPEVLESGDDMRIGFYESIRRVQGLDETVEAADRQAFLEDMAALRVVLDLTVAP